MEDHNGDITTVPGNDVWLSEAFRYIDESLENLLQLVTNLNERANEIQKEQEILKRFRKIFVALNFFVVPVIFAILLCYGTKASISGNTGKIETTFQLLVMALMLTASCIGLPLYVFSIWRPCVVFDHLDEDASNQSLDSLLIELTRDLSQELTRLIYSPTDFPKTFRNDLQKKGATKYGSLESRQLLGKEDLAGTSNSIEPNDENPEENSNQKVRYRFRLLMKDDGSDMGIFLETPSKKKIETIEDITGEEQIAKDNTEPQGDASSIEEDNGRRNVSIDRILSCI